MDKEKCLVPSVVSLHVRAVDDKEPLKNLFSNSDNVSTRRLSYNLVRIYNTSYKSSSNKPVADNLPPYLANVNSHTHSLNASVIDCRFNGLLRRANPEYPSLFPNNRSQLVSQFWSNSMRNHQSEEMLVFKKCPSPSSDGDSPMNSNSLASSRSMNMSTANALVKQNSLLKKKSNVSVRLEQVQEDSLYLPTQSIISKSKPNDKQDKGQPIFVITEEHSTTDNRLQCVKTKHQNSIEKASPRKPTPSVLLPIKERATTANSDLVTASQSRSQTSLSKTFASTLQKSVSLSLGGIDAMKINDATIKRNNSPLLTRLTNTQSNFMTNTQSFPYSDPCDGESAGLLLTRLTELSALESETVRWEKTKTVKRRPKMQIESM